MTKIGSDIKIIIGDKLLQGETSSSMSISSSAIDVSSKADGNQRRVEYGRAQETGSASGVADSDGTSTAYAYDTALAAAYAKQKVVIAQTHLDSTGKPVAGDYIRTGMAVITSGSEDSPQIDKNTCSIGWQYDGKSFLEINPAASILRYNIPGQVGKTVIDAEAKTVTVTVPAGTTLTALVASFMLSGMATAKVSTTAQVSGTTANDFTLPVEYDVTAGDGTTEKTWTVTVEEES